ncbi:MAG TPA: hypothetical protein VKU38_12730 [Ktedonobacteraceae bacterium]|nr:hypothetical protein [Ktedonobacteraceae bacterium]
MKDYRSTISNANISAWLAYTCSSIPNWTLLAFALLLLVSCANSGNPQVPTPQPTATTPGNHPSTATPQLTQQYEFTEQDSGRTVTYSVTSRFGISLNQQKYPKKNLQVSCSPPGTIGNISNLPSVPPPLYAVRYQGVQPGLCTIKNGTFLLTVRIVA